MRRLYSMIALLTLALLLAAPAVIADEGVPGGGGGGGDGGTHEGCYISGYDGEGNPIVTCPPDDGDPACGTEGADPCPEFNQNSTAPPIDPVSDWSLVRMFLDLAASIF